MYVIHVGIIVRDAEARYAKFPLQEGQPRISFISCIDDAHWSLCCMWLMVHDNHLEVSSLQFKHLFTKVLI